jgi:hypothetical protein
MNRVKYIVTANEYVIVFSECIMHSEFKEFNPISAGFVSFGVNKDGNPTCSCWGESISLGLESRPERDTELAKRQLQLNNY